MTAETRRLQHSEIATLLERLADDPDLGAADRDRIASLRTLWGARDELPLAAAAPAIWRDSSRRLRSGDPDTAELLNQWRLFKSNVNSVLDDAPERL